MGAFRKGYKSAWWAPSPLTYAPVEARMLEKRYKARLVSTGRVKADDYTRAEVEDGLRQTVNWRREAVESAAARIVSAPNSYQKKKARDELREMENHLRTAEADLEDERAIEGAALDRAVSDYIDAQRPQTKDTTTNGGEIKTYQRKEILFGGGIAVRVVPCFTSARGNYGGYNLDGGRGKKTGGSGVTTYWVMKHGRMVDSYLSRARAVEVARELIGRMPFDECHPLPQEKRA